MTYTTTLSDELLRRAMQKLAVVENERMRENMGNGIIPTEEQKDQIRTRMRRDSDQRRADILRSLIKHGPASKNMIARATGQNIKRMADAIVKMTAQGLLAETGNLIGQQRAKEYEITTEGRNWLVKWDADE